jgi:hypothetical protein
MHAVNTGQIDPLPSVSATVSSTEIGPIPSQATNLEVTAAAPTSSAKSAVAMHAVNTGQIDPLPSVSATASSTEIGPIPSQAMNLEVMAAATSEQEPGCTVVAGSVPVQSPLAEDRLSWPDWLQKHIKLLEESPTSDEYCEVLRKLVVMDKLLGYPTRQVCDGYVALLDKY